MADEPVAENSADRFRARRDWCLLAAILFDAIDHIAGEAERNRLRIDRRATASIRFLSF